MRVLVTGASGFVGSPLVRALAAAGYVVHAATRSGMKFPDPIKNIIVPDFTSAFDWDMFLQGIDVVVHTAGLAHTGAATREEDFDRVNHLATRHLVAAAVRREVRHFIFISSIRAQIGTFADGTVTELREPRPTDAYGRSKLAAEIAVRAAGIRYTIFRPVVIYGANVKGNLAALARLAALPVPLPFGSLRNRRSLLSIDNLISAIKFALQTSATQNETYVLADPEPVMLCELFGLLRQAQGRKPHLVPVPPILLRLVLSIFHRHDIWERLGCDLVVDAGKLRSTGWRPVVDTRTGLAAMMAASS